MTKKILFVLLASGISFSSCKVGKLKAGDYVRNENDGACICKINQTYPARKKMDVICQIGDSLIIAKKTKFWLWIKCNPDIEFDIK